MEERGSPTGGMPRMVGGAQVERSRLEIANLGAFFTSKTRASPPSPLLVGPPAPQCHSTCTPPSAPWSSDQIFLCLQLFTLLPQFIGQQHSFSIQGIDLMFD